MVGGDPIEREIVDDAALAVAQERILDLAHRERCRIVGAEPLHCREGPGTLHFEFPHVADVEQPDRPSHGPVLVDDTGVLHRHLPAAEGDHSRTRLDVNVVKRGPLERDRGSITRHEVSSDLPILREWHGSRNAAPTSDWASIARSSALTDVLTEETAPVKIRRRVGPTRAGRAAPRNRGLPYM